MSWRRAVADPRVLAQPLGGQLPDPAPAPAPGATRKPMSSLPGSRDKISGPTRRRFPQLRADLPEAGRLRGSARAVAARAALEESPGRSKGSSPAEGLWCEMRPPPARARGKVPGVADEWRGVQRGGRSVHELRRLAV